MRVAVIGGGISGLYLSLKLSKKHKVFLFEKKEKIGGKPCSSLYSERIFDFLPFSKDFVKNKIDFCILNFPRKKIKIKFKKNFFVFDRKKIEQTLFKLVKKSGVKIKLNSEISFESLEQLKFNFERIIGTDGANSKVRDFLKLKKPDFFWGIQGFTKEKDNSNFVEVWATKKGFLWKIPRGNETEYGILEKGRRALEIFENFRQREKIEFKRKNLAPIPQGFSLPQNSQITLCGDAAGLTKPWSGGGVVWSLTLCDILLKTFPDFLEYKKSAEKLFLPQISISKFIKKLVYFFGFNLPFFLPRKVSIDGDFF
jgi:flavin-dependent dehydrogenase